MSQKIRWNEPYYFYYFQLPNGIKKFGITYDLEQRKKQYEKRHRIIIDEFIFIDNIDKGWKAFLYEQVVRFLCEKFISKGVNEWIKDSIPKEVVTDAYSLAKEKLSIDLYRYQSIHKEDYQDQKAYYKQLANMIGGYPGKIDDWV